MNDTIETIRNIENFSYRRSANNGSRERCRRLANADALKRHKRENAFNLVSLCRRLAVFSGRAAGQMYYYLFIFIRLGVQDPGLKIKFKNKKKLE